MNKEERFNSRLGKNTQMKKLNPVSEYKKGLSHFNSI